MTQNVSNTTPSKVTSGQILLVGICIAISAGCQSSTKDGLYVYCDGTEDDLYAYQRVKGCGSGATDPNCYVKTNYFTKCIDPSKYAGTGESDTGGDIDLDDWVNDTESIDTIRSICSNACDNLQDKDAPSPFTKNCQPDNGEKWDVRNYQEYAVPDVENNITNPAYLHCSIGAGLVATSPETTTVIPSGSGPAWPSNPTQTFDLTCENYSDCSASLTASVLGFFLYDDVDAPWGNDDGRADYLATTSGSSSTILTLQINNDTAGPSSDTNGADGRIEYSAPDCGETECPLYVSNITLTNTSDTWDLYSESENDDIDITDISVRLRRPTLGVWNTTTDEIYIGEERLDLYVETSVKVGTQQPVIVAFVATNDSAVFGEFGVGGSVAILNLSATDGGDLEMEADLDYDTLSGSPPTASIGLGSTASAPTAAGLPISAITDGSSDPNNDLSYKLWLVDGVQRGTNYVIPLGLHTIRLEVEDARYAFDYTEQRVTITYP